MQDEANIPDRDYLINSKDVANIAARLRDREGHRRKKQKTTNKEGSEQVVDEPPKRVEVVVLGNAQDAGEAS